MNKKKRKKASSIYIYIYIYIIYIYSTHEYLAFQKWSSMNTKKRKRRRPQVITRELRRYRLGLG